MRALAVPVSASEFRPAVQPRVPGFVVEAVAKAALLFHHSWQEKVLR
jgi:hypothetical protein